MATTLSYFRTPIVSSSAPKNPPTRRSTVNVQSNKWWAPLFGWSSEPDYISSDLKIESGEQVLSHPETETVRVRHDKSCFRGGFTEEKAKELRKKTIETSTFHDIMYHSAIASRLASDVSGRYDR